MGLLTPDAELSQVEIKELSYQVIDLVLHNSKNPNNQYRNTC